MRRLLVAALLCLTLGACETRESIQLVSVSALAKNSAYEDYFGDPKVILGDRQLLRIGFAASEDLVRAAIEHEYNIGNEMSFCLKGNANPQQKLQNHPYVYDDLGRVDAFRKPPPTSAQIKAAPFTYKAYVAIEPFQLAGQTIFTYDLRQNAEDICLQLHVANMIGGRILTNTLIIPRASIVEALARLN